MSNLSASGTGDTPPSYDQAKSRGRAENDFLSTAFELQNVLKKHRLEEQYKSFMDPLDVANPESTAGEIYYALDQFISTREESKKNPSRAKKIRKVVGEWIRAIFPFSSIVLEVMTQTSAVIIALSFDIS